MLSVLDVFGKAGKKRRDGITEGSVDHKGTLTRIEATGAWIPAGHGRAENWWPP
jgi:hypothetical protein